jgi:hypothetical protein
MLTMQKYKTKLMALVISVIIIAALLPLTAFAEAKTSSTVENNAVSNAYNENIMTDIPWDIQTHIGFDSAFTPGRAHDPTDNSHIQLDGNEAYFYGYDGYGGKSWSDYLYYKEIDSTEKTFKFSMLFSIYPDGGGTTPVAQRWHSLYSVGFLVNCLENDDETISGYYISFEQGGGTYGQIVLRMLDHVDFGALYDNSRLMSTKVLDRNPLNENSMETYLYEIKASNEAFSVTKNGDEIFTLDLSTADASQIPSDYTGGNDFGFYAGYVGAEGGHTCGELSFAEFKNIEIWTKTVPGPLSLNAQVTSFNKNLQDKNNQNLKFTVTVTLRNGITYTVDHAEKVNGQQKGTKTFIYDTPDGSYSVYVAWNDNNTVTTCEVRSDTATSNNGSNQNGNNNSQGNNGNGNSQNNNSKSNQNQQ